MECILGRLGYLPLARVHWMKVNSWEILEDTQALGKQD